MHRIDSSDLASIQGVLLDVGGVFILPLPDRAMSALSAAGLAAPDDLECYRRAHYEGVAAYDRSADDPETWAAYHQGYARALGYTGADRATAMEALRSAWLRPGTWAWRQDRAVGALVRLSRLDLALGIVSNSDGTVEEALAEQGICQVGEGPHVPVSVIVDSRVVGHEKPHPAAFAPALAALGTAPGRTLFVGDTVRNDVRGAEAVGLRPVQLDPYHLYAEADHPRISDLHALVDALISRD